MIVVNKKYNKMIESYDFKNLPQIKSEIREGSVECFSNHSSPSEERLVADRPESKSLKLASAFFGEI